MSRPSRSCCEKDDDSAPRRPPTRMCSKPTEGFAPSTAALRRVIVCPRRGMAGVERNRANARSLTETLAGVRTALADVQEPVSARTLARTALVRYAEAWNRHALPELGHLTLRELNPGDD